MVQIAADHPTRLGFRFESDEAASFLVLNSDAKVLEYQALMLEHNRMRHVLPVDVVIKEGVGSFYFNITSKISLSFFLARRKLSREEFLKLLLNITSVVNDSAGYLLTVSNFVFDPDYIYISPETLDPMLVYIPAVLEGGCGTTLQTFIADLLMQHINVDGFGGGNLVQRILAEIRSELFNVKSLIIVINDLLYANATYASDMTPRKEIVEERMQQLPEAEKTKISLHFKMSGLTILAVLAQVVMGAAIFAGRHFLNTVSDNPTANYAAVVMIVLAIDLLIFRKLNAVKLIQIGTVQESSAPSVRADYAGKGDSAVTGKVSEPRHPQQASAKELLTRVESVVNTDREAIRAAAEVAPVNALPVTGSVVSASGKTELLARHTKGVRVLKSTRKQNGDEDIFLNKDDFIIGRLADHVDHVIQNNSVGKLHAQVLCRNGICHIKDLNSVNGTFINGNRIDSNKEYELKENDRVLLANSEFVYFGG
jgi:pSer/pThr/pTyr-binding forkhead associated (FHA) protein